MFNLNKPSIAITEEWCRKRPVLSGTGVSAEYELMDDPDDQDKEPAKHKTKIPVYGAQYEERERMFEKVLDDFKRDHVFGSHNAREDQDQLVSEGNELEDFGAEIRPVAWGHLPTVRTTMSSHQMSIAKIVVHHKKQMPATPKVDGGKPQASAISTEQQCKDDAVELYIEISAVPHFIGPNGRNVQALIRNTGVKSIFANQKRMSEFNLCPIEISGSSVAVEKARTLIEETYSAKLKESKTVWIANVDVPEFIGPCGKHVKALKKQSGIQFVTADQKKVIDGLCPIRIEGCPPAVKIAVELVVQRFGGSVDTSPSPLFFLKPEPIFNASKTPWPEEQALSHCDSLIDGSTIVEAVSTKPSPCLHTTAGVFSKSDEVSIPPQHEIMAPGPYPLALEQQNLIDAKFLPASVQSSEISPANTLAVVLKHMNALKSAVSISSFHQWLQSVDIESLEDLLEALTDDEVFEDMKQHGFKAFKRVAVIREVTDRLEAVQRSSFSALYSTDKVATRTVLPNLPPPPGFACPITHAPFRDHVIAADNQTYERVEIEAWFRGAFSEGKETPLSPLTGEPMEHLNLSLIAQLAHDFGNNHPTLAPHHSNGAVVEAHTHPGATEYGRFRQHPKRNNTHTHVRGARARKSTANA